MRKETKDEKRTPFEDLYGRLEDRVTKLEQGGLSLEESIALYEEGMTLARECQVRLDEAEQKITKLKESFAVLPRRTNGVSVQDAPADYEYVSDDEPPEDPDDFE